MNYYEQIPRVAFITTARGGQATLYLMASDEGPILATVGSGFIATVNSEHADAGDVLDGKAYEAIDNATAFSMPYGVNVSEWDRRSDGWYANLTAKPGPGRLEARLAPPDEAES